MTRCCLHICNWPGSCWRGQPEHNSYQHHGWVRWKVMRACWAAGIQHGANRIAVACLMPFPRTDSLVLDGVRRTYWKEYPKAENYYAAIAGQNFVRRGAHAGCRSR
jgi:hypothetical protein